MNPAAEQIKALVAPAVQAVGYELVEVKITFEHGKQSLTLFIDAPGRPVSIADCVKVSKLVNPMIEEADVMAGAYFLNVSSPKRKISP